MSTQESIREAVARTAEDLVDGTLPERWALQGLTLVRKRARRYDLVGEATHRALRFANAALKMVAVRAGRFEKATQPPARPPRRRRAA
ncbi:MAG TPA: hypothetical protein VK131_10200 [Candidatus Acidoferrales bacterium]|nr:hypothetical protein [Candidatus Acidoferrales bacterium]